MSQYRLKIASHFQDIVDGSSFDNNIYIRVLSPQWIYKTGIIKQGASKGVAIFGSESTIEPIKLKLL